MLTGERVGSLVVQEYVENHRSGKRIVKAWLCLCDCGNKKVISESNLRKSQPTSSCGCNKKRKPLPFNVVADKCQAAGYELLNYAGKTHGYSTVYCEVCKEVCTSRLDNVFSGYKPCRCSTSYRMTEQDIINELTTVVAGGSIIDYKLITFDGNKSDIEVTFPCMHIKTTKFGIFKSSTMVCYCELKHTPLSYEDYVDRVREGYILCLDETKAHDKKSFMCLSHNKVFSDVIYNHVEGRGCEMCTTHNKSLALSTPASEVMRTFNSLDTKYSYNWDTYKNKTTAMQMVCSSGHSYWQKPMNHLAGSRCHFCSNFGYKVDKPGVFYVLRWFLHDKSFLKFGITNRSVEKRIESMKIKSNLSCEVVYEHNAPGNICLSIERVVRSSVSTGVVDKHVFPDGYTETCVDSKDNLLLIEEIIHEHEDALRKEFKRRPVDLGC